MFDFQAALCTANTYASNNEYALATFHYWLINFVFENEEFPYGYTKIIGEQGRKGFLKCVRKHSERILVDESYLRFKNLMAGSTYNKYFENFERVVNYFINRNSNKKATKKESNKKYKMAICR